MKRIRILGLSLVVVFGFSAIAASSALALPEFVPLGGKFPVKFTSNSSAGTLETVGGTVVKCTGGTSEGEITEGMLVKKIIIKYTGCEATVLGIKVNCQSASPAKEKEIITNPIMATVGYLKKSGEGGKAVGMILEAESSETGSGIFAEFSCSTTKIKIKGRVVGSLFTTNEKKENNVLSGSFTLLFTQTKGVQGLTTIELLPALVEKMSSDSAFMESVSLETSKTSKETEFEKSAEATEEAITLAGGEEGTLKA